MFRGALVAVAALSSAHSAFAQDANLVAQGWSVGSVQAIAGDQPAIWTMAQERSALRSIATRLTCPQDLSGITLTAAKGTDFTAECWYRTDEREGVWATSVDSVDLARATVQQSYARMPGNPDLELSSVETSVVGVCTLEVRRIRNVSGFWVTFHDLYTADVFHQFRTITYSDAQRSRMDDLAQALLDLSISSNCAGMS